jgi:hypothetical protein
MERIHGVVLLMLMRFEADRDERFAIQMKKACNVSWKAAMGFSGWLRFCSTGFVASEFVTVNAFVR